jgi:hypothetical protein
MVPMKRRSTRRRNAQARSKLAQCRSTSRGAKSKPASSRDKVRAYRERMRARGMRLIQMWLPDTRSPEFAAEAHRQSVRAATGATAQMDQAWVESVSWWNSDEVAALDRADGWTTWWHSNGTRD